jgi:outer membrane protein assembly factor BamB
MNSASSSDLRTKEHRVNRSPAGPFNSLLCALCVSAVTLPALAENWPQYRGPDRSGIVTDKDISTTWPDELKEVWRASTGAGFASPVAADGKVYSFYVADKKETLEAFDANSGKSLWKQSYPTQYTGGYAGSRCTPVIDGDRIYTYGTANELVARKLADGAQLWALDLMKETGSKMNRVNTWGNASSPLIVGDSIYVQTREGGNAAVCVDKKSGKITWKSELMGGGYATPVLTNVGGVKLLLCFAEKHLVALDPKTGRLIWELNEDWETQYGVNATMPIVHDGNVFVSCAYNNGHSGLYTLSATGATKVWGGKQATARFQAPILDNGVLYVNSEGSLKCLDWATGDVKWASKDRFLGTGGTLVRFGGDKLLCLSDSGTLVLVKATPAGMEKLKTIKNVVEGKQVWASPLLYNGKLYIQGQEELVAFDIKG